MNEVVGTACGSILPRRRHALDDALVGGVREGALQLQLAAIGLSQGLERKRGNLSEVALRSQLSAVPQAAVAADGSGGGGCMLTGTTLPGSLAATSVPQGPT